MATERVVVIGAGIGGLSAAIDLAAAGLEVTVVERADQTGGKLRAPPVAGKAIDAGPTVFTMRWVFDELFEQAGASFERAVALTPLAILARHFWTGEASLDLHHDPAHSKEAIAAFAGADEAKRFEAFLAEASGIYRTLKDTFLTAALPGPLQLSQRIGLTHPSALLAIRPFERMSRVLAKQFRDPRLRQLFGRYATYVGSSPYAAPATLMLIAHVEQQGVWSIEGGMRRLADAMVELAQRRGVVFRTSSDVSRIVVERGRAVAIELSQGDRIEADAIVVNADAASLADGLFGNGVARAAPRMPPRDRSLSALTWATIGRADGVALDRHNIFFSDDYSREFEDLFDARRVPEDPTVYLCAQDRPQQAVQPTVASNGERMLLLINAPADGDTNVYDRKEIIACEKRMSERLARCGLKLTRGPTATTTPADFNRLFPATGGALYGMASHGSMASFRRPSSATKIPGLYLAGGSAHPGAGVPMAALSGRLAATRLVADLASTRTSRKTAIAGGMSTR